MGMWSAIVAIVAIAAFAGIARAKHHARQGNMDDNAEQLADQASDSAVQRELEDLRKRVAVLERIATEDRQSKAIAAEIEDLRDS